MAQPYKPLKPPKSEHAEKRLDEDALYWRRMRQNSVFQEPGHLTSTNFSPVEPYYIASTSSVRLSLYDASTCEPVNMYSRFKEAVYGAIFRHDGKLIAVGGQEGKVRLFDIQKKGASGHGVKTPLRIYKSHSVAVHSVLFTALGKAVIALGDDGVIKCYDIMETKNIPFKIFESAHKDHIRCGDASECSDHLFVSGSYDHTAKLWDIRAGGNDPILTVEHGWPVERALLLPGDALLATAGGQFIKIWDITSGGRLLHTLHHHHKTVTSLCLASSKTRLISGGLDKRINVFRLNSGDFSLAHSITTAAPILSLDISCNDQYMAVGMANLLAIFQRQPPTYAEATLQEAKAVGAGIDYQRRIFPTPNALQQRQRGGIKETVELTAPSVGKLRLGKIDVLLRQYKHWKVVNVLFGNTYSVQHHQDIIVAALREIHERGALPAALAGHKADTLRMMLTFLTRYLFKAHYFPVLSNVVNTLLDVYADEELDMKLVKMFQKLTDAVGRELAVQKSLLQAYGAFGVLFTASRNREDALFDSVNNIFGDVVIAPIPFDADSAEQEDEKIFI